MMTDPSLQGHFIEVHQRQIKTIVRSDSHSFQDLIMARVFRGSDQWKLQLTSEINVGFFYQGIYREDMIREWMGKGVKQKLWFEEILSGQHSYQLKISSSKQAHLIVTQKQKYKYYELVSLPLQLGSEEEIKRSVAFRYNRMIEKEKILDNYWENMIGVIKTKNPSLLLQFENKVKKTVFK